MYNSRFITITNSWLGKNEIFCLRFVWNLVWWILIPIPPTIPNFSWIGDSFVLVQNYDTRCLCNFSVICCQYVVQGSFSLLSLQILRLFLVWLSKWPSKNSLIHLYKRCAAHPSEGWRTKQLQTVVFKAKILAIETNQTPDWVKEE